MSSDRRPGLMRCRSAVRLAEIDVDGEYLHLLSECELEQVTTNVSHFVKSPSLTVRL
jgi:hypothetical protein